MSEEPIRQEAAAERDPIPAPCLTNESVFNRKALAEGLRAYRTGPRWIALVVIQVLLLLAAAGLLIYSIVIGQSLGPIILNCVLVVFVLGLTFYALVLSPSMSARAQIRRQEESYGLKEFKTTAVFANSAVSTYREKVSDPIRMEYQNLKQIIESKNLILLVTRRRQLFLLDRGGFQNGTEEDFWRLIAEKCPQAKLIRKKKTAK